MVEKINCDYCERRQAIWSHDATNVFGWLIHVYKCKSCGGKSVVCPHLDSLPSVPIDRVPQHLKKVIL